MTALLVLSMIQIAQSVEEADLMGMTPRQVVALGAEAWAERHGERNGWSTLAMSDSAHTFGLCRERVNNEDMAGRPGLRAWADQVRTPMTKGAEACLEAQSIVAGGGTMWNLFYAGLLDSREEAFADIIRPPQKMKQAAQAEVWAEVRRLTRPGERHEFTSEEVWARIPRLAAEFSSQFYAAMKLCEDRPARERGRIIRYFADVAATLSRVAGEDEG